LNNKKSLEEARVKFRSPFATPLRWLLLLLLSKCDSGIKIYLRMGRTAPPTPRHQVSSLINKDKRSFFTLLLGGRKIPSRAATAATKRN
jgi:hypothetical protein